jgi:hypothetical protein
MAFIRPDLLKKSLQYLSYSKPSILYIAIDGPRNEKEEKLVNKCKKLVSEPGWDCEVIPLFQDHNIGLVKSFLFGMEKMFSDHEFGIFLEDDVLVSSSFLNFCEELFEYYRENKLIGHINASNFLNMNNKNNNSYFFSEYAHVWGFGTWRRMWKTYDINMSNWKYIDQKRVLKEHCFNYRERNSLKKMFDLHCNNPSPWACDYQWTFNLINNNALSITPYSNMSLNVGFDREDSTHTKNKNPFYRKIQNCTFPLSHPQKIQRNTDIDRMTSNMLSPSYTSIYKSKIKKILQKKWKKHS